MTVFPFVFHMILAETQTLNHSSFSLQCPERLAESTGLHNWEESTHVSIHSLAQILICSFSQHISCMLAVSIAQCQAPRGGRDEPGTSSQVPYDGFRLCKAREKVL